MKNKRFSIIGGDKRQLYIAEMLKNHGISCCLFGFAEAGIELEDAINLGDIILFPIPSFKGYNLNAPLFPLAVPTDKITRCNFEGKTVIGGKLSDDFTRRIEAMGGRAIDIAERDDFAVLNAVSTAEGAIMLAIRETDFCLQGSRCLVTGYGRIGKILSHRLKALNAVVTATARRDSDIARIEADGFASARTDEIADCINSFDIVFNTVPAIIFDDCLLKQTCRNLLIIDLASLPGGVDFEAASKREVRAISALSLPGRTAPKAAGKVILDTVKNIILEEGL